MCFQEKRKILTIRLIPGCAKVRRKKINGVNTRGSKALIGNEKPCK